MILTEDDLDEQLKTRALQVLNISNTDDKMYVKIYTGLACNMYVRRKNIILRLYIPNDTIPSPITLNL